MIEHLSPTEQIWLAWYGRLRVSRYVGAVGDLYQFLTGKAHPKARGEAS